MQVAELVGIIRTQASLGRTAKGWDLGKGMAEVSSSSAASSQSEGFIAKDCINCGFVSSAEYFYAGCPNCGSKDHDTMEITK